MSFIIIMLTLLLITPAIGAPTLEEFAEKLKPLAQNKSVQADFTQTRHLEDLDFDMVINGEFAQEAGSRLAWITKKPLHSICLITPQDMKFWDGETKKTTTLAANKYPWIQLIFKLQSQWMNGDLLALKQDFTIEIVDDHTIKLTPLATAIQMFFKEITIHFNAKYDAVENVVFKEKTDDLITLEFENVVNNQTIPEKTFQIP
ncbi:MAG: outer membrane lipoprotein carrier protein LolA [Victivallales bacterium]|nr:outer membrane lipoprotein carrier protein LolA [Victivallales bacterium]